MPNLPYQHPSPIAGRGVVNLIRLLLLHKFDAIYLPKIYRTLLLSMMGAPSRIQQSLLLDKTIAATQIKTPPIFIIGHWRSGTTYIHNLLSQDPRFGYLSYWQAFVPGYCLTNRQGSRYVLGGCLPKTRPMDNVEMTLDAPQEEEYGLANLSDCSFYYGLCFPNALPQFFDRYVLFEGATDRQIRAWQAAYLKLLQIATIQADGRPLILKNPANTARISLLLDLFPDAKFIHIYRDPFVVYSSTKRMYDGLIYTHSHQTYDAAKHGEYVLDFYPKLMQKYFDEKDQIPSENLHEVCYEDFMQDPLLTLQSIYQQFNLTDFDRMRGCFSHYIAQQKAYVPNTHHMTPELIETVAQAWQLTIDRWGYEIPQVGVAEMAIA
jgi:omega-hydroxy-beta-dihydromenaquinone-9 sulfotransferase